ncbi:HoxN/HupN/NixA family nickel/cobalt transporter [Homoserinimonas sp. A520]
MAVVITLLLSLGWGLFFIVVLPGDFGLGNNQTFGLGLAFTAFTLGARHAFDADHIAAIDNTTRKLVSEGGQPMSVGFWFALGHSTVVLVAVGLLAAGLNGLAEQLSDDGSALAAVTSTWGLIVSGAFLLLIGTVNLFSLTRIWRTFRRLSTGEFSEEQLEEQLQDRGVVNRVLGPLARRIDKPWKMYPVGLLFGLGFDTATTIGLFVIGSGAALAAPWYVVLVLPILFAAGMTLFDTIDGIFMNRAYAWAYARPVRKVYYNLTVTVLSVLIAYLVGGVALLGLLAVSIRADAGPLAWIASLQLEYFGFMIVGLFLLTWLGSLAYWKLAKLDGCSPAPN